MENKSTSKIFVRKDIFYKTKNDPIKWSDIKHIQFEDDDIIHSEFVERHHSENNGWDDHFSCSIVRMVLETDEEFQKRMEQNKLEEKWAKERRYQSYLKLKKEFDTPTTS